MVHKGLDVITSNCFSTCYFVYWILLVLIKVQLKTKYIYILLFFIYRIIPESVRWLLANSKNEKAKKIICRAAKINNVTLSDTLMDSLKEQTPLTVIKFLL